MDKIQLELQYKLDKGIIDLETFLKAQIQYNSLLEKIETYSLEKGGKRGALGEIRTFGGRQYKKVGLKPAKWELMPKTGEASQKVEEKPKQEKVESSFDRGEKHHSEQVAYHTQQRDMHQDIARYIAATHSKSDTAESTAKWHGGRAEDHTRELDRLERLKSGKGLLSVAHLKVGDKFIATGSKNGESVELPIKITRVKDGYVTYIGDNGDEVTLDAKRGTRSSATYHIHGTWDFSKWKPAGAKSGESESKYEKMSTPELLRALNINNATKTYYEGKRGDIYHKETTSVGNDEALIQRIKHLAAKNGKPTKVTYDTIDTFKNNPHVRYEMEAEREYSYTKGTSVTLHWGDKKERIF